MKRVQSSCPVLITFLGICIEPAAAADCSPNTRHLSRTADTRQINTLFNERFPNMTEQQRRLVILYGSQTGNAQVIDHFDSPLEGRWLPVHAIMAKTLT